MKLRRKTARQLEVVSLEATRRHVDLIAISPALVLVARDAFTNLGAPMDTPVSEHTRRMPTPELAIWIPKVRIARTGERDRPTRERKREVP